LLERGIQTPRIQEGGQGRTQEMAAVDSDESDFGDDMALVPSMKAHTSG